MQDFESSPNRDMAEEIAKEMMFQIKTSLFELPLSLCLLHIEFSGKMYREGDRTKGRREEYINVEIHYYLLL